MNNLICQIVEMSPMFKIIPIIFIVFFIAVFALIIFIVIINLKKHSRLSDKVTDVVENSLDNAKEEMGKRTVDGKIKCPYCDTKNDSNASKCKSCGARLN